MLLTVAIPTFNRINKLVDRIGELLPQLNDKIEVRIFDNASDSSAEEAVRSRYGRLIDQRFIFSRSKINIGLAANLCRCFEHAEGEWLWILGDDDVVHHDAIENIISEIHVCDCESLGYISFSTSIFSHSFATRFSQLSGFVNVPSARTCLSNLLFISSGCFRLRYSLPYLRFGYLMVYSHVPHLAILASMLAAGNVDVSTSSKILVERSPYDPKQAWSYLKVISGLPALLDLEGIDPATAIIIGKIITDIRWRPFVGAGIHFIFNDSGRPLKFWWLLLMKIFIFGELKMKVRALLLMTLLPLSAFNMTRKIVRCIVNYFLTADVNEGSNRL